MSDEATKSIPKRSLLKKYDIPVEFLDFEYINTCNDSKTIENIVKILRSGEEGFYPQLTEHAEKKLMKLQPSSKLFRKETKLLTKECLDDEERKKLDEDIENWMKEMKEIDEKVQDLQPKSKPEVPIRKCKSVVASQENAPKKSVERIKSTDYNKWDKFDADAAIMKIDLQEERQCELVAHKNKKNLEKTKLIEEIVDEEVECLSEFEKDHLSTKYKEKGNECFKSKEYDEAIKEYTQSLRIKKTPAAFNNRALVYLKQKNFLKALSDVNECLKYEPNNVKALLRKAQAFVGEKQLNEALDVYEKVLDIDKENQIAKVEVENLRKKVPPKNAFRMKIEEINGEVVEKKVVKKIVRNSGKLEVPGSSHVPKMVQNIVIEDPNPFDKFKPKEDAKPRESLIMPGDTEKSKGKNKILIEEIS